MSKKHYKMEHETLEKITRNVEYAYYLIGRGEDKELKKLLDETVVILHTELETKHDD